MYFLGVNEPLRKNDPLLLADWIHETEASVVATSLVGPALRLAVPVCLAICCSLFTQCCHGNGLSGRANQYRQTRSVY
jgi:hypothetical protein